MSLQQWALIFLLEPLQECELSQLRMYVPQQELWIPFHTAVVTVLTSLVRCLCLISRVFSCVVCFFGCWWLEMSSMQPLYRFVSLVVARICMVGLWHSTSIPMGMGVTDLST